MITLDAILWTPGPEHDASPRAVRERIAAGEAAERAYEARREARREIDPNEDEDFRPDED
jgi:hypothetical protein